MPKSEIEFKSNNEIVRGEIFEHKDGNKHPGLLILHGLQSRKEELGNLPQKLFIEGYTCMLIDVRGHGNSDGFRGYVSKEIWLEDIKGAIEILESHPEVDANHLGLVGHSLGAAATIISSATDNRIKCAVALAPPGTIKDQISSGKRVAFAILYYLGRLKKVLTGRPMYIKNPTTYDMLFFDKNALEKAKKIDFLQPTTPVDNYPTLLDFNAIDYANKINIPTLIVVADKDKVVNPSSSMALFKSLQCEKKCVVINDSGHSMLLDQKGDEVISHTIQWFNRWLKRTKTENKEENNSEENVDEEEEELEEEETPTHSD